MEKLIFFLVALIVALKSLELLMKKTWLIRKFDYETMLLYCLKSRKNTASKNPRDLKAKNGRMIVLSNCAGCSSKTSRFKEQETGRFFYTSQLLEKLRNKKYNHLL